MSSEELLPQEELLSILAEVSQKVLIVDDDQLVLMALEHTLNQDGHDVLVASSGEDAIKVLQSEPIALVLCDQRMPGMLGTEVMQEAIKVQPDTIRMIITGNSDEKTAIEAINKGHVSQFIIKPWDDHQLRRTVTSGLEQYRLIHQNKALQNLLMQKHKALAHSHANLKRDLQLAAVIHETLLLGSIPKQTTGFIADATTIPSQEVDGDFFDFYEPAPGILDVVIGDVMGKGIPAAVVGTAVKTQLIRFATPVTSAKIFDRLSQWKDDLLTPWQILSHVHQEISKKLIRLEYFVCLFYGRFNFDKRLFSFVDCGSPKPIHYLAKEKKSVELKGENFPLGMVDKDPYQPFETHFSQEDLFVFYSDGVTECRSYEGELFGVERLRSIIGKHGEASPSELLTIIKQNVVDFTNKERFDDDVTIIIVKIDQAVRVEKRGFFEAKFSSDLAQLKAVRDFLAKVCKSVPGNQELLTSQLQLTINEAFCNLIEHSYDGENHHQIVVQANIGTEGLVIEISDKGASFDPSEIEEPSLAGDKDSGFGWHIIRSIADQVAYKRKQTASGWNHLRIFKNYYFGETIMELLHKQEGEVLLVTLQSESLDAKDAPDFKQKVIDLINTNDARHVIFDLQQLKFIDSSGLGSFLAILRNLNSQGGDLKLANMSNTVRTMFELVSMHKIFEIFATTEEALRAFEKETTNAKGK